MKHDERRSAVSGPEATREQTRPTAWKAYYAREYPTFWRQRAPTYGFTRYHRIILDHLKPQPGERILECGVGAGQPLAQAVAATGAGIHGVDIAASLLQDCHLHFNGAKEKVVLTQGDVEALPYADITFDKVYAISTTWYLPDLAQALGEMCRVTKAGGLLLFDVLNVLHITSVYGGVWRHFLGKLLRRTTHPMVSRSPWTVRRILAALPLQYQVEGYYLLLPATIPLLHIPLSERIWSLGYGLVLGCRDSRVTFSGVAPI